MLTKASSSVEEKLQYMIFIPNNHPIPPVIMRSGISFPVSPSVFILSIWQKFIAQEVFA